jgi:hypothetical protein
VRTRLAAVSTRSFIVLSIAAFALFGYGCGGGGSSGSFSSAYTASTTAQTANRVKLVPKGASGNVLVVSAVIYGPTTSTDLYSFSFDVVIGDPSVLAFSPGSAAAGTALTVTGGQTLSAIAAPDGSDPTHIVVGVTKLGGGVGNQVAGTSAVVVDLTFGFLKAGTSTLSIASSPAPSVLDHNGAGVGSIIFDTATGTATGVSTSGGGY